MMTKHLAAALRVLKAALHSAADVGVRPPLNDRNWKPIDNDRKLSIMIPMGSSTMAVMS